MLAKLTKRERVLIYGLIVVVIFAVGIMLLIMPAVNRSQTADSNYLKAKAKAQDMKMTIAGKDTAKMEIKDLAKELKSINKYFPSSLQSEKIDKLATSIVQGSGLKPVTLTINGSDTSSGSNSSSGSSGSSTSGTSNSSSSSSSASSSAGSTASSGTSGLNSATNSAATNAENQGNTSSGNNSSNTNKSTSKNLKYDTVTLTATGSKAKCIAAVERARTTKGVCIVSFDIQSSGSASTVATENIMNGSTSSGGGSSLQMVLQIWQRISTY